MKFQIVNTVSGGYRWRLVTSEYNTLAVSYQMFDCETDTRSNIAEFRKSVGGVKFAKVEVAEREL